VKIHYGTKTFEWDRKTTVKRILERLEILPETVIVARNGEMVTEDEQVSPGDEVDIVRAISGG
jgi:sulfur carrier protein